MTMAGWYYPGQPTAPAPTQQPVYQQPQMTTQMAFAPGISPLANYSGAIDQRQRAYAAAQPPGGYPSSSGGGGSSNTAGILAVLRARENELALQRSSLNLSESQLGERMRELASIRAAEEDLPNLIDVARGIQQTAIGDKRRALGQLSPAIEIQKTEGAPESLPPGVRYRIESEAERLKREAEEAEEQRRFELEERQLALQEAGLKTTQAQIDAQRDAAKSAGSGGSGGGGTGTGGGGVLSVSSGTWARSPEAQAEYERKRRQLEASGHRW